MPSEKGNDANVEKCLIRIRTILSRHLAYNCQAQEASVSVSKTKAYTLGDSNLIFKPLNSRFRKLSLCWTLKERWWSACFQRRSSFRSNRFEQRDDIQFRMKQWRPLRIHLQADVFVCVPCACSRNWTWKTPLVRMDCRSSVCANPLHSICDICWRSVCFVENWVGQRWRCENFLTNMYEWAENEWQVVDRGFGPKTIKYGRAHLTHIFCYRRWLWRRIRPKRADERYTSARIACDEFRPKIIYRLTYLFTMITLSLVYIYNSADHGQQRRRIGWNALKYKYVHLLSFIWHEF